MNKFITLAILCFVCHISRGNDFAKLKLHVRDFDLKGKVKLFMEPHPILEDTVYHYFDENGYKIKEVQTRRKVRATHVFKRDSKGQITEWTISYTHESHPDFLEVIKVSPLYDKNSNLTETRFTRIPEKRNDGTDEDEEEVGRVVYKYDNRGNTIEKQEYDTFRLLSQDTYKYDNNVIEIEGFTEESTYTSKSKAIFEYNAKKEILSIINYDSDGDKITNRQDFTYIYNANGTIQEQICQYTDYNDTENNVVLNTTKYEYDSNENPIRLKMYSDGALQEQIEFKIEYYK